MIRLCGSEDALAAVLAHEIGHVEKKHGLKAIKKGRLTSALAILAAEGAKNLGNDKLAELTVAFEGSINDIAATLVNSGYARELETEADRAAVTILQRVGYAPHALVTMLTAMKKVVKSGSPGFGKTHPDPDVRIRDLLPLIGHQPPVATDQARQERYTRFTGGV
jgi:predicted Zn-dependent protease